MLSCPSQKSHVKIFGTANGFHVEKNITRKPKKKNCGTACSASRLAKTRTYDSFCVRFLVSVDPLLFLFQASKSTGINFFLEGDLKSDGGGGLFFRLEFRRRTRRKIGLLPIVTSLWKNKYTLMLL